MTTAVTSTGQGQTATSNTSSRVVQKSLGKDDFLKLMIEQLKCQNPLEPMSDTDSIAQMANFSSLEQMQNLNASLESLKVEYQLSAQESNIGFAVNLIGKNVSYLDGEIQKSGEVESMTIVSGVPLLSVGNDTVGLEQVFQVKPATA